MKVIMYLALGLGLISCASMNEKINGYSESDIYAKKNQLEGQDRDGMIAILGKPVAEGLCYAGSGIGVGKERYSMVYRKTDSVRYKHALDMTSEKYIMKCTLIHLNKKVNGKYVFSGLGGIIGQTMCNQKSGVINRVRNPKMCKTIYKSK
jgi:hypothetical protein